MTVINNILRNFIGEDYLGVEALGGGFLFLHSQIVVPFEIVPVLQAKAWINELLWEHFDCKNIFATRKATLELNVNGFAISMLKNHIAHFKAVWSFFRFLPSFYISVKLAIFCYWMPPKLTPTARFLALFELYSLFLFIFW